MTRVVVTGYASLDHVVSLDGVVRPGATTRMRRMAAGWARPGGSPAYVATALTQGGAKADIVSWVGADDAGRTYQAALAARGLSCTGIAVLPGVTPVAILAYAPDGGCICLYDPGLPEPPTLAPSQAALLHGAAWVCITVGPPGVTDALLDALPAQARLAWAVKDDAHAVDRARAARLAARADLICHSAAEAGFVAAALAQAGDLRPDAIRVETRGAAGAAMLWRGRSLALPAPPLAVRDPTGAGDTLVGGIIAGLIRAPEDTPAALAAGIEAACSLLRGRLAEDRQ